MNEQIEIEYKLLISQDIFESLLKEYNNYTDYIQTNYYFTHPILQQKTYMLRIREKNNQYELTLKRPYQGHRLETNIQLTLEEKENFFQKKDISNEIIEILKKENISIQDLEQPFSLTTHRYDIQLKEGILSLDKSTYLDQCDYELEFEVNDEKKGYEKFLQIIQPYHLFYNGNCASKIKRVLNAYHSQKRIYD